MVMKKSVFSSIVALSLAVSLTACQMPPPSQSMEYGTNNTYSRDEVARGNYTQYGTLLAVKPVKIEGESSLIATALGAGLAGYGASHIGGGKAKYASATVGAAIGGMLADSISEAFTTKYGAELTVKLDNGNVMTFVQENSAKGFHPRQRVKVLTDATGKTRISAN